MNPAMAWPYAYTPRIWPPILTVLLMIGLAIYAWPRRRQPGVLPFIFALFFGALWAAGSALEAAALDSTARIFWFQFQAAWQLPSAVAVTCFLADYAWPGRWLTPRNLALLAVIPLAVIALILTNDLHRLMYRGFTLSATVTPLLGPAGWFAVACGYSLVIVNFTILAWLFLNSPQQRGFVLHIFATQLVFRTLYLLDLSAAVRADMPLDVIGLSFAYLMYSIALFRFHILNPIPLARQVVIDQMREGMLVVNIQGKVASLNPAAAALLGRPEGQVRGRPLEDVLPPAAIQPDGAASETEFSLGSEPEARNYLLSSSLLKDWRGQQAGRLLLIHDVTEQRRSQAQILEQQQALSILHERESLARELHDELAQDLALINLQAQLVNTLLAKDQRQQALAQLEVLARAAREAQVDVRGEIGNLSHRPSQVGDFVGSVRYCLEVLGESAGVEVEIVLPDDPPAVSLGPTIEVQLLRIMQEAFANIRKHARAKNVRVSLTREPGCLLLSIEDDGVGFEADRLPHARESFGLGIMSRRAAEVGGRVEVQSAPGIGTQVIITVPVSEEAG